MKIAVAMSGGVDSSVAAYLMKSRGHDVVGLTMDIWSCRNRAQVDPRVCCGPEAIRDAARVAEALGIRHSVVDLRRAFEDRVVGPFVSEYASGRTPNPCVLCNRHVKFGALLAKAAAVGATHLATGHHAVVGGSSDGGGRFTLTRAKDRAKDQTYFLYAMTQEDLGRVLMPVGELSKDEVRQRARDAGLHVAERAESQDLCFVPGGDLASFLAPRVPTALRPGPIEDLSGTVVGEHAGIALYTVGQRGGLGLSRPRATYVLRIDAARNTLVVGDEDDLSARGLVADELTWIAGTPPGVAFRANAKIRYASPAAACEVELSGARARVTFDAPQRAVAPGQAVVFYDGGIVLGGGTIRA
jgi:tRNA-specific 2-thiouridylase